MPGSVSNLGLGTSLDLQGILDGLKKADEISITKIKNEKTELEARRNEFNTINAKLLSMKSDALNLSLSSNYLKRTSSISNKDVMSATISDGADLGSHAIAVSRLAGQSSFVSAGMASATATIDVSVPYTDTSHRSGTGVATDTEIFLPAGEDITVTYGSGATQRTITLNGGGSGMSLRDIANNFKNLPANDDGGGNNYVDANIVTGGDGNLYLEFAASALDPNQIVQVTDSPAAMNFSVPSGSETFSYSVGDGDPISITVPEGTTLTGLAELINDNENNGGVTASVINTGSGNTPYKLLLKSNDSGESNRITFHSMLNNLAFTEENGAGFTMRSDNAVTFDDPIVIRAADGNTDFVFAEDNGDGYGSSITATIADGVYQNGDKLAQAVEAALEEASNQNGNGADYTVSYNTGTQRLEITQDGTLTGLRMDWTDPSSKAAASLGFTQDHTITPKESSLNSAFTVDGINYQREKSSAITDVVEGISFNLAATGSSNLSITQDTSNIAKEIKDLVTTLNELIKEIDANDDYNKETDTWGTLAKTPSIRGTKEQIVGLLTTRFNTGGSVNSFHDLGFEVARDGTVSLDESVLNQKLSGSFSDVQTFFLGKTGSNGVADQLNDMVKQFTKAQGLMQSEMTNVDARISQINEDIKTKTEHLDKRYDTMASQFTELDKYLRQMQSQQNFITRMTEAQNNQNNNN